MAYEVYNAQFLHVFYVVKVQQFFFVYGRVVNWDFFNLKKVEQYLIWLTNLTGKYGVFFTSAAPHDPYKGTAELAQHGF